MVLGGVACFVVSGIDDAIDADKWLSTPADSTEFTFLLFMPYVALGSETNISESAKHSVSTSVDDIACPSMSHLVKSPLRM